MDLKPGYKQTEVGLIPDDWDICNLGKIGQGFIGLTYDPKDVRSDGVLVLRSSNITDGELQFQDNVYVEMKISERIVVCENDLLICVRNGSRSLIGKCALIDHRAVGMTFGAFMTVFRSSDNRFVFYCFQSNLVKRQINEHLGATINQITNKSLTSFQIPYPKSEERSAITKALGDADALIESLEQLLTKKRQIKKGAMQQLLTGKKRLPGFSGDWKIKRLGQLGGFLKGRGVTRDESATGDLACVRYGELYTRHDNHIETYYSWISREVATTATRLEHGDVLFAGSGETKDEIGKCATFVDNMEAYAGGDIVILRNKKADPMFLGYYLNTGPINRQKASKGQGDAIVHIGAEALTDIQCTLPDLSEQTAIANILSDLDAEITALEAKLSKAHQIKQGMMQELLTGRIRLL